MGGTRDHNTPRVERKEVVPTQSPKQPSPSQNPQPEAAETESAPVAFKAILEARRPALMALPEERIYRRSRLDPNTVATIAMAGAQKVAAYRTQLVALCGPLAGEFVDSLRPSAMAARQASIELASVEEARDLSPLHREVMAAYNLLMTDAESLVNRGHLPKDRLERARDVQGYQAALDSLMVLIAVLREHWDRIVGLGPITKADIDNAEDLALRMIDAIAARDHGALRAPAAELRVRALSQVMYEYDQLRRMLTYLRWDEDDADIILPSLYAGRGRRPRTDVKEREEPEVVEPEDDGFGPSPETPSPNNGGPPFVS